MDCTFFEDVKSRTQYLNGEYKSKKKYFEDLDNTVKKLESENELLRKTEQVLKHLVDKLVKKDLEKMDSLITYGLNTVFPGRNLCFKSVVDEHRGKIRISLQTIYNGEIVDSGSKSSISVIESFLLRILCLIKLKKAHLLLLDETFSALDSGYIENLSKLISQLSEKLDLDILAVTHNTALANNAKNIFKIVSKKNSLEIEKTK